ncbi:MAG: hypothetical protein E7331_04310 [Clostridiales bacterium]|nr:hypothetical protein [Clostridiales bacterium]
MTNIQMKKRLLSVFIMAMLVLTPLCGLAEAETSPVSAEEVSLPTETTAPAEGEPVATEETREAVIVPEPTEAGPSPAANTAAPSATPTAAPKETPCPFTEGYAWAQAETRLYTEKSQSDETLLVSLPRSAYLYVTECQGSWAQLLVALRTEEGVNVMEAYVPLYQLGLLDDKAQAEAAASVLSKAHTDHQGITLRIITITDPVEDVTPEPQSDAEATPEAAKEPSAEPSPELLEEPTAEPSPELTEEPSQEPATEVIPEPTAAPSVSIVTHASSPVSVGDSVTLEAVAQGFDHEPVFLWEFRLPDGDKWYPYEGENSSTLTFIINRYNSGYIWRVTAE